MLTPPALVPGNAPGGVRTLVFLVTEDWYFISHRLPLAKAAVEAGFRVVVATRVRAHGEQLREAGCEVVPLEWSRGAGNPFLELVILARVVQLYRLLRPAVVHHVALKPVILGSIAAMLARVPCVVNAIAGLGYLFINADGRARVLRPIVCGVLRILLNRRGTWVILQNPDDQEVLSRLAALDRDRTVLIRGAGVDVNAHAARPLPDGRPIVVLPARLLWDKGVGEFVDAARTLRSEKVDARFVLAGGLDPANPRAIDRSTVDHWVEDGAVEWWGHCEPMRAVYLQASVICLPSYREGLPKALLEAAATGRPLVTTDVPGCREVVRNGDNGLLVPPHQSGALASALRTLLGDPALRTAMGLRSRARAEAEFDVERVIAETLELYRTPAP